MASNNYRPQTKFAKVMFLHLSIILFTGGVSRSTPRGMLGGLARGVSRPPPRGEVRGSGWGVSRPPPKGRLGGLAGGSPDPHPGGSRPTPGGFGVCLQTQAGSGSQHALRQTPPRTADIYCCRRYRPTGMHSCLQFLWKVTT